MHYVYAHVRVRTGDRSLQWWSTCCQQQSRASAGATTMHLDSPAAADPSPAKAPLLSTCWSKAGEVLARVLASELRAVRLAASANLRGTPGPAAAAALALDMSALCDPCCDRAVSPAAFASAASSFCTLHHPCRESPCASHASSRHHLMVKMQRQPQSKNRRAQQRRKQRRPAQSRPARQRRQHRRSTASPRRDATARRRTRRGKGANAGCNAGRAQLPG